MQITKDNLVKLCESESRRFELLSNLTNARPFECASYKHIYSQGAQWASTLPDDAVLTLESILDKFPELAQEVADCYSEGSYAKYFNCWYELRFWGRRIGAIGTTSLFQIKVLASSQEQAAMKAYDTHEHIVGGVGGILVTQLPADEEKDASGLGEA